MAHNMKLYNALPKSTPVSNCHQKQQIKTHILIPPNIQLFSNHIPQKINASKSNNQLNSKKTKQPSVTFDHKKINESIFECLLGFGDKFLIPLVSNGLYELET